MQTSPKTILNANRHMWTRQQKRDSLIEHVKVKTLAFKNCNVACRFSIADFHQSMKDGIVKFDESKQKVC